jgi:hypothetical protein
MRNSELSSSLIEPVIGVFIGEAGINNFNKQQPYHPLAKLQQANMNANATLYFFSINDVDLAKYKITGTYFNAAKNRWEKKIFPYPDIIYKRGLVTGSLKQKLSLFEKQLKKLKVKHLNYPYGFNKWEVYEKLKKEETLLPHIPKTIIYQTADDLNSMLNECNTVYLKACRGGRGKQVIRVKKLPKGYEYRYYIDHQLTVQKASTFHALVAKIMGFYRGRKFIVQEAIDLINIDHRIVDMRAELQRNSKGEIILAAIPVRVSKENAPITTHADSYTFEYFYETFMNYSPAAIDELKEKITQFLIAVYQAIEKAYGPSGEIGIDLGLDKQGRLWFIECNSRSMKVSFFKAYDDETILKSFENLLGFGKYLVITQQLGVSKQ